MIYYFTGKFVIAAENEESARDGLLELLSYLCGREDSEAFEIDAIEYEENQP